MEQEIKQINETLGKIHQWQNDHQIIDSGFQDSQDEYHGQLDIKMERLISGVDEMKSEVQSMKSELQSMKTKMGYTAWLTNTSEGVSKIDKTVLTILVLIGLFVVFGMKAVVGTLLAFFNIKL